MPREIITTVYKFAELSTESQSRAIESVAGMLSRNWGDLSDLEDMTNNLVYSLAEKFGSPGWDTFGAGDFPGIDGVRLDGWDLDRGERLDLAGTLTRENAPALPWAEHIDSVELSSSHYSGSRIYVTASEDEFVPHAEYDAFIAAWDKHTEPMRIAIESAIAEALSAGRTELDYLTSAEYAQEWIEGNEPEFTESGDLS